MLFRSQMVNLQSNQNKMESKIIKQQKNPFLEREELTLEIKNEVAPSLDELRIYNDIPQEILLFNLKTSSRVVHERSRSIILN